MEPNIQTNNTHNNLLSDSLYVIDILNIAEKRVKTVVIQTSSQHSDSYSQCAKVT